MLTAIAIFLDGLGFAAWLFLASVGLTLIYGVMRILNIAHGLCLWCDNFQLLLSHHRYLRGAKHREENLA